MISHPTVRASLLRLAHIRARQALLLGLISLTTLALGAPAARAAEPAPVDPQVIAQLIELNKRAIIDHRSGRHEAADKALREAVALAEKSGLGNHDMAARTHVHLGIVAIAGLGQRDEGLRHFARARALRPGIKLTRQLATAPLRRAFAEARKVNVAALPPATAAAPGGAPTPGTPAPPTTTTAKAKEPAASKSAAPSEAAETPVLAADSGSADPEATNPAPPEEVADVEPDVPVTVPQPLYCPTPMEGPPQADVRLHCLTQNNVSARKVVLYYRPGDGENYTAMPMNRTKKGWFSAIIPGNQVTGRALQFYVEAQGETGYIAASNGKDELPNVLVLKDGAPRVGVGALAALSFDADEEEDIVEEDTPLELREKEEQMQDARGARRAPGKFWAGLGLGSGYGWHRRLPLENHRGRQVSPGFSPLGPLHATPELGYQLTERLSLSVQGRHQFIPSSGSGDPEVTGSPPSSAHAVLLRAHYALLDLGKLQLIGTGSLGYGSAMRMKIDPAPSRGLVSSDTVVAGPVVGGPGAALAYNITGALMVVIEARTLVAFPELGALLEGTGGVQYAF